MKNTGREEMNPFESDRLREHFRKQGLSSKEIARRVVDIQFEREKRKEARIEIESLMAAALEGGERELLENSSFLNRTSYKLGGWSGTGFPWRCLMPGGISCSEAPHREPAWRGAIWGWREMNASGAPCSVELLRQVSKR